MFTENTGLIAPHRLFIANDHDSTVIGGFSPER
jgi:hypothetical protein